MKTKLFFAAAALALASCSSDSLVDNSVVSTPANPNTPMGFAVSTGNMGRTDLNDIGIYNFGVWAYKGDAEGSFNENNLVMNDFLVGYYGTNIGYKAPDGSLPKQWFYDGLGNLQYEYNGEDGYYRKSQTDKMSNNTKQYLKYWDYKFAHHYFYAYSPYTHGPVVTFDETQTKPVMTFPNITMGKESDYMYAANIYNREDNVYGTTVPLEFHHLNAKLCIRVYCDFPGYNVTLTDVVTAINAKKTSTDPAPITFSSGEITYEGTHRVTFFGGNGTPNYTAGNRGRRDLEFKNPTEFLPNVFDGKSISDAVESPTKYFLVPYNTATDKGNDGYIFYFTYQIKARDNGAKQTITNAGVFVTPEFTQWEANKVYTYVFKITNKPGGGGDPSVPSIGGDLKPIVFDGMTVADYNTTGNGSEWVPGSDSNPESTFDAF